MNAFACTVTWKRPDKTLFNFPHGFQDQRREDKLQRCVWSTQNSKAASLCSLAAKQPLSTSSGISSATPFVCSHELSLFIQNNSANALCMYVMKTGICFTGKKKFLYFLIFFLYQKIYALTYATRQPLKFYKYISNQKRIVRWKV